MQSGRVCRSVGRSVEIERRITKAKEKLARKDREKMSCQRRQWRAFLDCRILRSLAVETQYR